MDRKMTIYLKGGTTIDINDTDDQIWNQMTSDKFDWNKMLILNSANVSNRMIINLDQIIYIKYG
jgi:hypothetical protein